MVSALLELGKAAKEIRVKPIEVVKLALVLRTVDKGLLQALTFGVVTVLLFKGLWLWIVLALLLAVILPIYHVTEVTKEFEDEEELAADAD